MKTRTTICGALGVSLALAGCAPSSPSDSTNTVGIGCGGAIAGEILLGNMSSLVAAACASSVAIASLLDKREQQALNDATIRAADSNERIEWSAPAVSEDPDQSGAPETTAAPAKDDTSESASNAEVHTGISEKSASPSKTPQASSPPPAKKKRAAPTASGWIIPVKTYIGKSGDTCRDLQQHAEKGAKKADENVTLCKTASGWVIPQKSG